MTPEPVAGRRSTLPASVILAVLGLGILGYVATGYAAAFGPGDGQTPMGPAGLLFAAAAVSALVTAWGLWQHRAWARLPGRVVGVLGVLVGLAVIAYLVLLITIAGEAARGAIPVLCGTALLAILAGVVTWWSAGAVRSAE